MFRSSSNQPQAVLYQISIFNTSTNQQINKTKFLIPYEQLYIQSHHHHKRLIPEQYSGEYNPMYQLVYDQQVKPRPTKPPDLHPQPLAQ
jgi:hypothetical protein